MRDFLSSFVDVRLSMFMVHTLLYRYGTYYHGIDYNTATDENPRYNEDGGKTFAVVTDENVYYQLGPDVPGASGGSCESVESGGFGGYRRC